MIGEAKGILDDLTNVKIRLSEGGGGQKQLATRLREMIEEQENY